MRPASCTHARTKATLSLTQFSQFSQLAQFSRSHHLINLYKQQQGSFLHGALDHTLLCKFVSICYRKRNLRGKDTVACYGRVCTCVHVCGYVNPVLWRHDTRHHVNSDSVLSNVILCLTFSSVWRHHTASTAHARAWVRVKSWCCVKNKPWNGHIVVKENQTSINLKNVLWVSSGLRCWGFKFVRTVFV